MPAQIMPASSDVAIRKAAACLRAGQLVAFPTETVYGLGADATNGEAVARIFAAKGRPRFNPLIVHVATLEAARRIASFGDLSQRLAEAFWPGGLTLVVERREAAGLSDLVSAGLSSVAIRVPSHPIARRLIEAADLPIAAPSANVSGHVSATTAAHVAADFADPGRPAPAIILDGGAAPVGVESTIVDARGPVPVLLRPGAISLEALEAVADRQFQRDGHGRGEGGDEATRPRSSPGQLESHYAPAKAVILDAQHPACGQALLAFGPAPAHNGPTFNLSPAGDLVEAASRLFEGLRTLDCTAAEAIAVMAIPEHGLGLAINDRLRRAAAPRPAG